MGFVSASNTIDSREQRRFFATVGSFCCSQWLIIAAVVTHLWPCIYDLLDILRRSAILLSCNFVALFGRKMARRPEYVISHRRFKTAWLDSECCPLRERMIKRSVECNIVEIMGEAPSLNAFAVLSTRHRCKYMRKMDGSMHQTV